MSSNQKGENRNELSQNCLNDCRVTMANIQNISDTQLNNAQSQSRKAVETKLKEFSIFERMQKTFLYDERFIRDLLKDCSPIERPFVVLYLNRLRLFDCSVDLDYLIAKNMNYHKTNSFRGGITIGFVKYDENLIGNILNSVTGILETDLMQYFYWIPNDELILSAMIFSRVINQQKVVSARHFTSPTQFKNSIQDVCVARAFHNAVQSKLSKAHMPSNCIE